MLVVVSVSPWQQATTGLCFDPVCEAARSQIFVLSVALPVVLATAVLVLAWQKVQVKKVEKVERRNTARAKSREGGDQTKSDSGVAEGKEGGEEDYDNRGFLVKKLDGFSTFTVPAGAPGTRLKIDVGPVGQTVPRTFFFDHEETSVVFKCVLDRPVGISFSERGEIVSIDENTDAWRQASVERLNQGGRVISAPQVGDMLRATSSINFFYSSQAIFGLKPPKRTVVMFGCDTRSWNEINAAFCRSTQSDGDLILVLERPNVNEKV